jgi:hypothetical protein
MPTPLYSLMFGTPLPDPTQHPAMMARGRDAFAILEASVQALDRHRDPAARTPDPRLDALGIWALLHGMATLAETSAMRGLGVGDGMMLAWPEHALARMHAGLLASPGTSARADSPRTELPMRHGATLPD